MKFLFTISLSLIILTGSCQSEPTVLKVEKTKSSLVGKWQLNRSDSEWKMYIEFTEHGECFELTRKNIKADSPLANRNDLKRKTGSSGVYSISNDSLLIKFLNSDLDIKNPDTALLKGLTFIILWENPNLFTSRCLFTEQFLGESFSTIFTRI